MKSSGRKYTVENVVDKKYQDYPLILLIVRHALQTLYIYTTNLFPGVHFNNLFAELQLFNYSFTTLSPAARCLKGFRMHAKEEGFAKDGVYKAR